MGRPWVPPAPVLVLTRPGGSAKERGTPAAPSPSSPRPGTGQCHELDNRRNSGIKGKPLSVSNAINSPLPREPIRALHQTIITLEGIGRLPR